MIQLKIKTLSKGWHDKDVVMLHAMFQLLLDFMEEEHPAETIDWKHDGDLYAAWKEIKYLYRWWKIIRPKRRSPLDDKSNIYPDIAFKEIPGTEYVQAVFPDRKKYPGYYRMMRKYDRLQKKWDEEDQRNLHRLIDVRKYLWM